MIRFPCTACGRNLRAPPTLAGKRGRCAQCGAVNAVPPHWVKSFNADLQPTSVAVRRAAAPSPFRSTADLEPAPVGAATRFIASDPLRPSLNWAAKSAAEQTADDFFDHVAWRVEGFDSRSATAADQAPQFEDEEISVGDLPPVASSGQGFKSVRQQQILRWVAMALACGTVLGFALGLLASRWLL